MDFSRSTVAALGLGSNLGDRGGHLARALIGVAGMPRTRLLARSRVIESAAVGVSGAAAEAAALGGPYLNAAALVLTMLPARELLDEILRVEAGLGRVRNPSARAAARTIDIDLLVFGSDIIRDPDLTVPHPRMTTRPFVLGPLAEIAPQLAVPGTGKTIAELHAELTATSQEPREP